MQTKKTKKRRTRRVVTKREYVAHQVTLSVNVTVAVIAFVLGLLALIGVPIWMWTYLAIAVERPEWSSLIFPLLLLGGGVSFMWYIAYINMQEVKQRELVTPLSRYNTGDLPEDETLVRASQKSPTRQAEVLLRAAQGSQTTPEEQLLRAMDK